MSTHNNLDKICVAIVVGSLVLTGLFMNGEALGITKIVDEDAQQNSDSVYFTTNDQNGNWDTSGATVITLTGDGVTISGKGAYTVDGNVVITNAGYYVVSGTLTDGYISVDAYNSSKVFIMLDGAEINCSDDACIRVDQAEKVFLTLAEGSQNTLSSGSSYCTEALNDGTDGAIYAHDDLTINGSGSLTVTAQYRHGIAAKDDLVITGGTITVTAEADAIHANDSLRIKEATITADAGDDGLVTSNEEENGYFYIESGTLDITASDDAIHTTGDITFAGGSVTIDAGDDGVHSDSNIYIQGGTILIEDCYEGIEALNIDVSGGDVTVYPQDDGLNANGGSGDMFGGGGMGGMGGPGGGHGGGPGGGYGGGQTGDGQSSDSGSGEQMGGMGGPAGGHGGRPGGDQSGDSGSGEQMSGMPDGEMPARPDAESADGEMPTRPDMGSTDGEMPTPPDMGSTRDGQMPPDMGSTESGQMPSDMNSGQDNAQTTADTSGSESYIKISGGTITIINETGNDADGLDSNGDILISGGTVYISLVGTGSNNAVDYGSESGGVAEISGGTIIACGASSMAEAFDTSSTQASILYNTSATVEAGTTLAIEDADGNVLISWDVPCSFSSALISCPEMQVGGTYTVVFGDNAEEITLSEVAASYGDAQSSGYGGDMNWGGMKSRKDQQSNASGGGTDSEAGSETASETERPQGGPGEGQTPPDMSQGGEGRTAVGESQDGEGQAAAGESQSGEGQVAAGESQDGEGRTAAGESQGGEGQVAAGESQSGEGRTAAGESQGGEGRTAAGESREGMTGGPAMQDQRQQEQTQAEEDLAAQDIVTAQPVDGKSWAVIGGSTALLVGAAVIVLLYKRP